MSSIRSHYDIRLPLLILLKAIGAFRLARWVTRGKLRILCYHGFSLGDENLFSPLMYMRPERFESRLRLLQRLRFPVIPLAAAVEKLARGDIDSAQVVITIDDGWKSNLTLGLPLLEKYGYPATVYVITEHLGKSPTAFNMCVAYMFWKSRRSEIELTGSGNDIDGRYILDSATPQSTERLINASKSLSYVDKQSLLPLIANACGLNFVELNSGGRFDLMNEVELAKIAAAGLDLQLHTHEHNLPAEDFDEVARQIRSNADHLSNIRSVASMHFCYPSGNYSPLHPDWLRKLGIVSATTCDIGLNDGEVNPLLLRRVLDRDDADDLIFEAEMCGVMEIMRKLVSKFGHRQ